jgi:hypothetical protein
MSLVSLIDQVLRKCLILLAEGASTVYEPVLESSWSWDCLSPSTISLHLSHRRSSSLGNPRDGFRDLAMRSPMKRLPFATPSAGYSDGGFRQDAGRLRAPSSWPLSRICFVGRTGPRDQGELRIRRDLRDLVHFCQNGQVVGKKEGAMSEIRSFIRRSGGRKKFTN